MRATNLVLVLVGAMSLMGCNGQREYQERQLAKAAEVKALQESADANYAAALQAVEARDYDSAEDLLKLVKKGKPDHPEVRAKLEEVRAARKEQEEAAELALEMAAAKLRGEENLATRKSMETDLRSRFLDRGLDIKVDVSGKNHDRLRLTYVLFSDVWSHRFQKDGLVREWCDLGFRKIEMRDGYDWGIYWDC